MNEVDNINALSINGLVKIYDGGKMAVNDLDMTVEMGDFFALLGPNGAGKSTIINCIVGLSNITEGSISIFGKDTVKDHVRTKLNVGIVPQEFNFAIFEKVIDILITQAGYYGVPVHIARHRADEVLKALDLYDKRDAMAMSLSGGMKRRLMIARALIHRPKLLILDEPTAGVDVEIRQHMWKYLRSLNADGTTIILTTHYLEEAESLCNKVAFIKDGKIIETGNMKDILDRHHGEKLEKIYLELIHGEQNHK